MNQSIQNNHNPSPRLNSAEFAFLGGAVGGSVLLLTAWATDTHVRHERENNMRAHDRKFSELAAGLEATSSAYQDMFKGVGFPTPDLKTFQASPELRRFIDSVDSLNVLCGKYSNASAITNDTNGQKTTK